MATGEDIFSNNLLRSKILFYYVRDKYMRELNLEIKKLLDEEIIKKWYRYCSCDLCSLERDREFYNNLV